VIIKTVSGYEFPVAGSKTFIDEAIIGFDRDFHLLLILDSGFRRNDKKEPGH
jgi:hypothetical protein